MAFSGDIDLTINEGISIIRITTKKANTLIIIILLQSKYIGA